MRPLTRLPKGARARVAGLPEPHVLAKRLCALGLTPGAEVCVLQNRGRGPLIVEVHGARLALGRGQADRVEVEVLDTSGCVLEADPEAGEDSGSDEAAAGVAPAGAAGADAAPAGPAEE